ncbi:MAG: hypothetical protein F6K44_07615 [Moorea sp. SIO3E2]|nr:hypothetical protein [Moorena sp. SIO3E2]
MRSKSKSARNSSSHSNQVHKIFSRLPTPDSRLPTPDSLKPTTCVTHPIKNCYI